VIVDTHAHLQWPSLAADLEAVLERARAAGVERSVVVGTDLASSRAARELARAHAGLFATAGVHPCSAHEQGPLHFRELEELLREGGFVAVGETGLDQHHRGQLDRAEQLDWLHFQLDLAVRHDLPAVIHCRRAFADLSRGLVDHPRLQGVVHCFSEGPAEQERLLAAGLYISFAGPLTRSGSRKLRAAARETPADRLLVETDSPFLGAGPGDNEPSGARQVVATLAELRGTSFEEQAALTSRNAERLFRLPSRSAAP
jgi:TatD DNase family protein